MFLDSVWDVFCNIFVCLRRSSKLKINGRNFRILRLLREGGFSYVYLVEDLSNHRLLALKKIHCPFGEESVARALREVDGHRRFSSNANVIDLADHEIVTSKSDASEKTVYILLPYYNRGNLQDLINSNLVHHSRFSELRLMKLMLGVCGGLHGMHRYRSECEHGRRESEHKGDDDDDDDGGGGDDVNASIGDVQPRLAKAYAHADIKPSNIMIGKDNSSAVVMDLGSLMEIPLQVTSRSMAIAVQDNAAENSTMPYRAPELFDVKTNAVIDGKIDIWSFGCTLYTCLVGKSPFEFRSEETGGSLSLCVMGEDWRFPDEHRGGGGGGYSGSGYSGYGGGGGGGGSPTTGSSTGRRSDHDVSTIAVISEPVKDVVRKCLQVEPCDRPDISELTVMVEKVVKQLEQQQAEVEEDPPPA